MSCILSFGCDEIINKEDLENNTINNFGGGGRSRTLDKGLSVDQSIDFSGNMIARRKVGGRDITDSNRRGQDRYFNDRYQHRFFKTLKLFIEFQMLIVAAMLIKYVTRN